MVNKFNFNLKKFFKSKSNKRYFTSYFLVIFCMFAFSITSFFAMTTALKDKFDKDNTLIVNTVSKSLNEVFKKVDDVYKTLENFEDGNSLFESPDHNSYNSTFGVVNTPKIAESILMHDFIEEIVFMSKDKDYLITSKGAYNKTDFFDRYYNSEECGEIFFDNLITDYLNVKVIPATTYKNLIKYPTEDPKRLFAFVKTDTESNMNTIIFISEEKFKKATNLDIIENNVSFKVYDYNNSVIFSNNDSNYLINTKNISKNFENQTISHGAKKYYIEKSSYNNFYYVAEIKDFILSSMLFALFFVVLGFIISLYYLIRKISAITEEERIVYDELSLDVSDNDIKDAGEAIKELKEEISESKTKVDTMTDEIKSSIFLKLISSTSFYTRNRKNVELVFEKIMDCEKIFILSVETIKENNRFPKFEIESITNYLNNNSVKYVHIEEKTRKNVFVIGLTDDVTSSSLIDGMASVLKEIRENYVEVLVCYSKEFKNINNLNDAFRDIKICRDYRGIDDKNSVLNINGLAFTNHLALPINFKEELTGKIMAKEEESAKEYLKEILELNIKNNIPISKFEFMLRQMLSIITETITMNRKGSAELYELEQVFLLGIDNLKDNFDVYGIVNSLVNILHLSISMCDNKKNTLNRPDVIKYINSHYSDDLYLEKIATEFGTTPKYFSNYFKKEFMIGFNEYLTQVRISHAKQILLETELSLAEVGMKAGYANQATFAVAFKKTVGVPPGKYREMNNL